MPETPDNAETRKISGKLPEKEKLLRQGGHQGVHQGGHDAFEATGGKVPPGGSDHGIVRDERGQEQPRDKERAQEGSRVDRGDDPPGKKA